ncbi:MULTISPECIES: trigger factor [unclassified Hahella]|uniref:trigger factor n=1 Tax=unclassified Hahella TaxID=2624107 RepID=UPI001C1EC361|nr:MULTISPECIES: trigger factor [unclassified Hahella]MBU6954326.1 trigger factor [Hahella sp. HN01]MDG9667445.1 trigger factor [Hahella sp. CR1]
MQVSLESTSSIERRMTIGVPATQVNSEVEKRLQKTARTVRMNGFRPGKVPMSVVKKRYGEGVRQEVIGEMMRDAYVEALQKEDLNPAGYPKFEPKKIEDGEDLEFIATFEIYPEVAIGDLSSISVEKEDFEIVDADVDTMIDKLRQQSSVWKDSEDAAADGDRLTIDFKGMIDGEAFEGGSAENAQIVIGSKRMIPGFEDGLVGLKAGDEKTLDLTFPEDYHAENLKGKPAQFEVKVSKVERSELPEINDEFFAQYGVQEGGEEAFKVEIRKNMEREAKFAIANKVKQQVVDQLLGLSEFDVPSALVDSEVNRMREDAAQRFGGGQMKASQLPAELFKDQAVKRVKTGLIFAQVVKDNGLEASEEQIEAKIRELASSYQEPEQVVSWYMSNPEQKAQMQSVVLEDVVVDFVADKAKIETKSVSYEDAVKPRTAPAAEADQAEEAEQSAE